MAQRERTIQVFIASPGDLAEGMLNKALSMFEKLNGQEGMATAYGNLGQFYTMRGELDRAEERFNEALAIDQKLCRQEGMANTYAGRPRGKTTRPCC